MPSKPLTAALVNKMRPPLSGRIEIWDTYLPGFGLRISDRGVKTWIAMTRVHGRKIRLTLGRYPGLKLKDARELARKKMRLASEGVDPREYETEQRRQAERLRRNTFGAIATDYMADRAVHLKSRNELQRKLDVDILPHWRDRPMRSITRRDVRQLLREKARTAPIAANRVHALIGAIFNWALVEEFIDASPVARLTPVAKEPERERVLSADEIRWIWGAAGDLGYPFGTIYQFLLATDQRRGEVADMKWSEIEGDRWMLPAARTKGGAGHAVPLSSLAVGILKDLPRFDNVDHVFISNRCGRGTSVVDEITEDDATARDPGGGLVEGQGKVRSARARRDAHGGRRYRRGSRPSQAVGAVDPA